MTTFNPNAKRARKFRKQSRIMWMWKENNGYLWLHSLGWTKQQAADFALYPGRAVKVRLVEVPAKKKGMVSRGK